MLSQEEELRELLDLLENAFLTFSFGRVIMMLPNEDIAASDAYTLKSDSSSTWTSFPSRIPETICTKNDAMATYGVRLRISLYGWKDDFITFPRPPDSGP